MRVDLSGVQIAMAQATVTLAAHWHRRAEDESHRSDERRYESVASQPTLDVIRRLAVALQVSALMSVALMKIFGSSSKLSEVCTPRKAGHQGPARRHNPQTRSQTLVFRCLTGITLQVFA